MTACHTDGAPLLREGGAAVGGPVMSTGRGWAYAGAVLGGVVSTAANVAHSFVPPPAAAAGWSPQPGAVVGAVFWPVALLVAVEILARTAWPAGRRWAALRFGGMLPVALVAAVVSYRHLSGLLAFYGEDVLTQHIGPLAVDGLMVMASGALIATGARRHSGRPEVSPTAPSALPRQGSGQASGEVSRKVTQRPRRAGSPDRSPRPASKPWEQALSEARELVARYRAEGRPVGANTIKTHIGGVGTTRAAALWDAVRDERPERPVHLVREVGGGE